MKMVLNGKYSFSLLKCKNYKKSREGVKKWVLRKSSKKRREETKQPSLQLW